MGDGMSGYPLLCPRCSEPMTPVEHRLDETLHQCPVCAALGDWAARQRAAVDASILDALRG